MNNLDNLFKEKIKAQLPMTFHDYMHMALYDGEYGYYATKEKVIGADADFVTAPELTPLFGQTIAKQILNIEWPKTKFNILELGAGNGRLCLDIMRFLQQQNASIDYYYILEVSPYLKHKQQQLIQQELPEWAEKVIWLDALPVDFSGFVLANEVLDAMPVHRFLWNGFEVLESYIVWEDGLKEQFLPTQNMALVTHVQSLNLGPEHYCSEVNLWLKPWLKSLDDALSLGLIFLIDYGYVAREYYHPDRNQGTLMCHYQQRSLTDFLHAPGEMDITAHVDFSLLAESAHQIGFFVLGFCHQASFLLANGILDLLVATQDSPQYFQNAQALKLLLQSQEMGDIFKVMVLGKGMDIKLQGFMLQDRRESL